MRRRTAIAVLPAFAILIARLPRGSAETAQIYRIGFLSSVNFAPGSVSDNLAKGVLHNLAHLGYTLGTNLEIEKRSAGAQVERLPGLVDELVAAHVAVMVTNNYPGALAAKRGTSKIPIVLAGGGDPVKTGLVASLARPGGNITGISDVAAELAPKRLEFLKEAAPQLRRVAMLWNANDLGMSMRYEASAAAARKLGISVESLGVREPNDFDDAFRAMERDKPDGLLMVADALTTLNRKRVYEFAAAHHLAAIYEYDNFARDGGLMSYGPDREETEERVASLIDRLLKGANPANLPLEQPTRFRLVINLNTARALNLTIPPSLLARADEVIE
jgi:putative tryptophan/tyrosine transport system substrate-binding protein